MSGLARTLIFIAFLAVLAMRVYRRRYFGRVPGDLHWRRGNWTFRFPIVTCLILSGLLSLLFWLFARFSH